MRLLPFIALILLALATGQETPPGLPSAGVDQTFFIIDSERSIPIRNLVISLAFTGNGGLHKSAHLVNDAGAVQVLIEPGDYALVAEINDPETAGTDYFAFANLKVQKDSNRTLAMMPVGTITGSVLDENKTVAGAHLALKCASPFYDAPESLGRMATDEFGNFLLKNAPAGNCELLALSNGRRGSVRFRLERGELLAVDIFLREEMKEQSNDNFLGILMMLASGLLVGIVVYAKYFRNPGKQTRATTKAPERREKVRTRPDVTRGIRTADKSAVHTTVKMSSILRTLSENERKIVNFLLEQGGKGRQNRIYHSLLIPKVTLSRAIFSLENKNIIQTRRIGKVKELELTKWFME